MSFIHPCLRCGACCATYRVAFYWTEAERLMGGRVPIELTAKLDPHRLVMRGTESGEDRCVALQGTIGEYTACGIYERRPGPCRELVPAWELGQPSPQCDRARLRHGMSPLTPEDWESPDATAA